MMITRNISESEIACHCGCGQSIIEMDLIYSLQHIRDIIEKPIIIHCLNRCETHNKNIGGVENSMHIKGMAADFHVKGVSIEDLHTRCMGMYNANFIKGGLGLYDWGVHIDIGKKRNWDKRNKS